MALIDFIPTYGSPIQIPIFLFHQYFADIWHFCRYFTDIWPIFMYFNQYFADTDTDMTDTDIQFIDTDISVSVNLISVSVISVSANVDIGYIGIGKISVKIHRYWPNIYRQKCQISAKYR